MPIKKRWGGRFEAAGDELVDNFGASIGFDQAMAKEDIMESLAHVKMLKATKILSATDADQIIAGLEKLADRLAKEGLTFTVENEDIHMNIESLLTDEIGPVAGKLHTARSRNDQVAVELHLYVIDRELSTELLGFDHPYANSLDAVSDRDFALEFLSNTSILMVHLSRLCEELIYWCSYEFGYVELADQYATGSSIMPQKKNPDMAELIRGKTRRIFGDLTGLLTVMKGLPLAYNKDMQEDKEGGL